MAGYSLSAVKVLLDTNKANLHATNWLGLALALAQAHHDVRLHVLAATHVPTGRYQYSMHEGEHAYCVW